MFHDPIVEEVRAIRERLAAQFNFDIREIIADARRRQATSAARIVPIQRTGVPAEKYVEPDKNKPSKRQ